MPCSCYHHQLTKLISLNVQYRKMYTETNFHMSCRAFQANLIKNNVLKFTTCHHDSYVSSTGLSKNVILQHYCVYLRWLDAGFSLKSLTCKHKWLHMRFLEDKVAMEQIFLWFFLVFPFQLSFQHCATFVYHESLEVYNNPDWAVHYHITYL
jgi:hypothetical protein